MANSVDRPPFNHEPEEILERITDVFFALDAEWRVTYLSSKAEEIVRAALGENPEAVLNQSLWNLIPEIDESIFAEKFHEAMETQEPVEFEAESLVRDGWVTVRAYPSENGLSVYFRDITERVKRQQELERQNERLEKFTDIVSHDLRSPLNIAQGRLDLLEDDCESEHVGPTLDALTRMEHIVDDMLTLARQGQVVDTDAIAPVSLADIAAASWRAVDTKKATLSVETELRIMADSDRLRHILENLFRNAVEHANSEVTVRIDSLDDRHGFYVEDDGPGIPEDERNQVLERGFTTDSAGTGLGLSIVREIVTAHDWEITVGEGSDGGARFVITGIDPAGE